MHSMSPLTGVKTMLPIQMDWLSIHTTTENIRIVMARFGKKFGVVIFDPDDTMHQLPLFDTEDEARKAKWLVIKEIWGAA